MNILNTLGKYMPHMMYSPCGIRGGGGGGDIFPPFYLDLERYNTPDTTGIQYDDAIGEEERTLIPDMCIVGDTINTVTFPVNVLSINWIKPDKTETLVVLSGAWIIPSEDVAAIKLYSDVGGTTQIGYLSIQDKSGVTLYDMSGNSNHATLSNESVRDITYLDSTWRNESNLYGWNEVLGVLIPPDLANPDYDVQGNLLVHKGIAKYNAEVMGAMVGEITTTATLTFTDLTGITIVSSTGTSTPTINGNIIELSTGVISYLELSDGSILYFNGNTNNSKDSLDIASVGVTFKNDYSVVSKGVENGYVQLSTGEQIINTTKDKPSFTLPVGAILVKGGGFNSLEGSYLNMDKEVWETYVDADGNEHIDSPNRSENLVVNGDFETDSNNDGLADNWSAFSPDVITTSIVTDINGNKAQRWERNGTDAWARLTQPFNNVSGTKIFSCYLKAGESAIKYFNGVSYVTIMNANNEGYVNLLVDDPAFNVSGLGLIFALETTPVGDDWGEVSNVKIFPTQSTNEIGHVPHNIFNQLNWETNPFTDREMIKVENLPLINIENPYYISPEILTLMLAANWYNDNYAGHVYFKVEDGVVKEILPYTIQRTQEENDVLIDKGYLPNYII